MTAKANGKAHYDAQRTMQWERAVLGCLLESPEEWEQVGSLRSEDFLLTDHRKIFQAISELHSHDCDADIVAVVAELGDTVAHDFVSALVDGNVRPNFASYVRNVQRAACRRRTAQAGKRLARASADAGVPAAALASLAGDVQDHASGEAVPPHFSEDALALRFSRQYGDDLRYVARWAQWLRWDGARWVENSTLAVFDLAREICREASAECGENEKATATRLASKATRAAVESLAEADRRHAASVEQFDADPWLLNCPAGTIDLRTGELRPHSRADYITKITASAPGGECPLWLKFLDRATGGDSELQAFLRRMVGYSLTGITREHALFFCYGTGSNGKSVFLSTISALLAGYAKTAPASTFIASATEQHPADLASLRGARLVSAIETEDGVRWAESRIKSLTGGDRIAARFMRCNFFEYTPEFKLLIVSNHKPSLRSVDEAIKRRLHLIPFYGDHSRGGA